MPTYLDFNTTSNFRDKLIGRTLQQPNGPQTFTANTYRVQTLSDFPNVDPGDVETVRPEQLLQTQTSNIYKPTKYFIVENLNTLPRRANLSLYPYFTAEKHNLIGIMGNSNYDTESELFKFAAYYIKEDKNGPVFARISQNLEKVSNRIRLLDALNGNTSTAINLLTGREPLVEGNNQITVAKTLPGKGVDFLKTVSGVELPFSTIPGDYLSNPSNPINYRPQASTEVGKLLQDTSGALGSLLGIQRRPTRERKPSDLFIEYMGDNQKKQLFNLLTYSKYGPNYTTTARSQNTSKVFNFVNSFAQGVKNVLGVEAPASPAYIGDDRGNDVKFAMGDFNDRPVRSSFYLTLMFDELQARLFQRTVNIENGGKLSGNLTWISKNSKNKLGENNKNYTSQRSNLDESLSTKFGFREDSILGITQQILDSMPSNGGESRTHVANVIDQTSRVFIEGDVKMSRGSAVKYVDKVSGEESGIEYCRVWTKDRPYFTMDDTMKRTSNIRKFEDSVLGGESRVWNLNIAPMSNGNKSFDGSTNIVNGYQYGGGFYARKYMFSIENLAWKTSNKEGFMVQDLPYCERGPNGGRVMWFPPYDLKVQEQNNAKWEENMFLGRPEPVYTYQNTTRSGSISFKVIVDHPSILNLLVREYFKDMSDEEADNYINAFFAGCQDLDLYDLVKRYTTLDSNDVKLIQDYLNKSVNSETITKYKNVIEPVKTPIPDSSTTSKPDGGSGTSNVSLTTTLNYINDLPTPQDGFKSSQPYTFFYNQITPEFKTKSANQLTSGLTKLVTSYLSKSNPGEPVLNDIEIMFGSKKPDITTLNSGTTINNNVTTLNGIYNSMISGYDVYDDTLTELKQELSGKTVQSISVEINSSTSAIADNKYNMKLSYRRTYSVIWDILNKISLVPVDDTLLSKLNWGGFSDADNTKGTKVIRPLLLKDLGYDGDGKIEFITTQVGENTVNNDECNSRKQFQTDKEKILNVHAPISVKCRRSKVILKYTKKTQQPKETVPPPVIPTTRLEPNGVETITTKPKKPPIDVMKRIIMKTLSECYYFKKLEEDSPIQFSSLKEKLRYFHPAFHSMTPEGLNARLTFLNQCIRPGDTIQIKGISDDNDLNARNTTFGPPPVCVIRIGDFYHSKVVITNVAISFDDTTWDLNPEGIGVQPMIANVQLQLNFIGGHGLANPVEKLQNALSSNFYANTEMYDERSISTNKMINGMSSSDFTEKYTKELLEKWQKEQKDVTTANTNTVDKQELDKNVYIGTSVNNQLSYTNLISDLFEKSKNYFSSYSTTYNESIKRYGKQITSLLFSNNYRKTYQYDVYETANGTSTSTIELIGVYDKSKELNVYLRGLKTRMVQEIESNVNSLTTDMFDIKMSDNKIPNSDSLLKPELSKKVQNNIDNIIDFSQIQIKNLEQLRNEIIIILDKLNYLVYNVDHDAKTDGNVFNKVILSGFTSSDFYNKYSKCIEYISKNNDKITSKIDNSVDFNTPSSITQNDVFDMISIMLNYNDQYKDLLNVYTDKTLFRENYEMVQIKKSFDKFFNSPSSVDFKFKKEPKFDGNEIKYGVGTVSDITNDTEKDMLKKVFNKGKQSPLNNKLNYYRS